MPHKNCNARNLQNEKESEDITSFFTLSYNIVG